MRISPREACVKPHLRTRSDIKKFYLVSQESFFEEKNLFFYLQKTDEIEDQNFQKNFKHLPFAKENASWLTALTVLKQ